MARPRSTSTAEFKLSAVKMITARKLSVAEAARRRNVGENLLREWRKAFLANGDHAFPGHGHPAQPTTSCSGCGPRTRACVPSGIS